VSSLREDHSPQSLSSDVRKSIVLLGVELCKESFPLFLPLLPLLWEGGFLTFLQLGGSSKDHYGKNCRAPYLKAAIARRSGKGRKGAVQRAEARLARWLAEPGKKSTLDY